MKRHLTFGLFALFSLLLSCSEQTITPAGQTTSDKTDAKVKNTRATRQLRFVTYNIHGGKGPNDEGDLQSNLHAFKAMLNGEELLFFQEVQPEQWATVKSIFPEFPYTYYTEVQSAPYWDWWTFSFKRKKSGNTTLSKISFNTTHDQLIQKDPGGDLWERKAQHIAILVDNDEIVDFFHYHNTYNWNINNFASEKEGMVKFGNYVLGRLGIDDFIEDDGLVMLGDYNLFSADVNSIISTPFHNANGRDHINATLPISASGYYPTVAQKLSDHNAVWASATIY